MTFDEIKINLNDTIDFISWFTKNKEEIEDMSQLACEIIPSEPGEMQNVDRILTAYYARTQFLTARAEHFYKNKLAEQTAITIFDYPDYKPKQVDIIAEKECSSEARVLNILERLEKSISSSLRTLKTEISFEKEKAFNTKTNRGA